MAVHHLLLLTTSVLLHTSNIHGRRIQRVLASPDIPLTSFSCIGRHIGYYADVETDCQVYHMCGDGERQYSYQCPNTTLFHQRMLICAHWYQVNCSRSVEDYSANLLIGQRDKPFVPDFFTGLGEDGVPLSNGDDLQEIGARRAGKSVAFNRGGHANQVKMERRVSGGGGDLEGADSGSVLPPRGGFNRLFQAARSTTAQPTTSVTSRPTNVSFRSTIETPSSDPALARTRPMTRPTPRGAALRTPRPPSRHLQPPKSNIEESSTLELHLQDPRRSFYIPEDETKLPAGEEPIVVSIQIKGDSRFRPEPFSGSGTDHKPSSCSRCHPLFVIDRQRCTPCVLIS